MRPQTIAGVSISAIVAMVLTSTALSPRAVSAEQKTKRPNILLIVVDDMGYSDLGPFGGEIRNRRDHCLHSGAGYRAAASSGMCFLMLGSHEKSDTKSSHYGPKPSHADQ